jgi:hypothetical protein
MPVKSSASTTSRLASCLDLLYVVQTALAEVGRSSTEVWISTPEDLPDSAAAPPATLALCVLCDHITPAIETLERLLSLPAASDRQRLGGAR